MVENIQLKVEIFQEDDLYVGVCPALDVSSNGTTIAEARTSAQEALKAFVEEYPEMETLTEVLKKAGFTLKNCLWLYPQPVTVEMVVKG